MNVRMVALLLFLMFNVNGCNGTIVTNGMPDWYVSNYDVTNLDAWLELPLAHRRSYCLDAIRKIDNQVNVELATQLAKEITGCAKKKIERKTKVSQVLVVLYATHKSGYDMAKVKYDFPGPYSLRK